jgi:hypothetical protein
MSTNFLKIDNNGCASGYWNNPNISISTGVLNVGQASTISVTVHNTSTTEPVRLNHVQVTVCALNTMHGFNATAILPSLRSGNGLAFDNVFNFPH